MSTNQLSSLKIERIMMTEDIPMSAFLLGSVSRGLSRACWLGAKTLTFGQETGAAPDEVACLTSMHDSISREVIRDAHLQAVGLGEQGAFGHPDRGPLPDERRPHARPEEGRDLVPSALLVCRSDHKVRFDARSRNLSSKLLLLSSGCTWTTR